MFQTMYRIFILLLVVASINHTFGQQAIKPQPSPTSILQLKYKDTYVKITYSQPHKRGRTIFGNLVPFNEVWRTGANEATEITCTRDIYINKVLLPAGTYSVFTIPNPEKWTIIINKETGLWGSYNYNPKLDFIRFDVPVAENSVPYEAFTIVFEQRNNVADLILLWDTTKISIPLQFIEPKP